MKTAVIYARYSSEHQNPKSVDDQILYCKNHLIKKKVDESIQVSSVFYDHAEQGENTARFGLNKLIKYVTTNPIDYVLAENLDRISRDPEQTHFLYKVFTHFSVEIMSVTEGIITPLHICLKGTMNWMYSKEIGQKVIRSHSAKAQAGLFPAGNSYGYKVKYGVLDERGKPIRGLKEIVPEEAQVVKRIFEMYADGAGSKAIAQRLNHEGIPSPSGGKWSPSTILGTKSRLSGILLNKIYNGKLVYNRTQKANNPLTQRRNDLIKSKEDWIITDVPELKIIDNALWERVQTRAMQPKAPLEKPPKTVYRSSSNKCLSGLVFCGVCGAKSQRANGTRYVCGSYRTHRLCKNARGVKSERLMEVLLEHLKEHIENTDFKTRFDAGFEDNKKEEIYDEKLVKIDEEIESFVAVIDKGINLDVIVNQLKILQIERAELLNKMKKTMPTVDDNKKITKHMIKALDEMEEQYRNESFAPSWRAAMSLIVDKIVTTPIPNKKKGMTVEVKIAGIEGWAEFYRRITAKKASD